MTAACPACVAIPTALDLAEQAPAAQFSVPSIRCATCIGTIERHFHGLKGVALARVNATQKRVTIQSDLPDTAVVAELQSLGYDAYPLDQAALAGNSDPLGQDLILRLGVAGFAMMNVMLLSVAVWSGAEGATRDLFHLISACLAVPVIAYIHSTWGFDRLFELLAIIAVVIFVAAMLLPREDTQYA